MPFNQEGLFENRGGNYIESSALVNHFLIKKHCFFNKFHFVLPQVLKPLTRLSLVKNSTGSSERGAHYKHILLLVNDYFRFFLFFLFNRNFCEFALAHLRYDLAASCQHQTFVFNLLAIQFHRPLLDHSKAF